MGIKIIAVDIDGTIMYGNYFKDMLNKVFLDASKKTGKNIDLIKREFEEINKKTEGSYEYYDWNMKFKLIGSKLTFEELLLNYLSDIKVYDDALSFLEKVSRIYPIICATNGYRSIQETKLRLVNLLKYFKDIITADDCKSCKPQPDFYRCIVRKLKVHPTKILFIDDIYEMALGAYCEGMIAVWINRCKDNKRKDNKQNSKILTINNFNQLLSLLNLY